VVNNAGVALVASVSEMSWDDLEWVMNIDYWGVVHGTKAFLPHLIASGDGHLVKYLQRARPGRDAHPERVQLGQSSPVRGFTEALRQEMLIEGRRVG